MAGIHLHPHDLYDEGTEQIFRYIEQMGDIHYIFPEMNSIFERNPCPTGSLPRNTVHSFVQGNGTLHIPYRVPRKQGLYQKQAEEVAMGHDSFSMLQNDPTHNHYNIIPWVNVLNGDFAGTRLADNQVVDFRGRMIPHWLCPNGPDVISMWSEVLLETTNKYGWSTYLIDRIRFPDWSGETINPGGLFSCFCGHCRNKMKARGIHSAKLITDMKHICDCLTNKQFDRAVHYFKNSSHMQQWIQFRQDSVSEFVEQWISRMNSLNPNIAFWLDLWPPSYAWLLGQDYTKLTQHSRRLKHFPYHKLGGGADVQGFIEFLSDTPEERESAFQAFLALFEFNYQLSYEEFKQSGYPLEFIRDENNKVRRLSQPGTFIFSGIQMWNIRSEELHAAIEEARASEADDVLYYCYGWADTESFQNIGEWNRQTKTQSE